MFLKVYTSDATCTKNNRERTLLIKLIERGITFQSLADKCGVDIRYIQNQIYSNFPRQRARLLVESVLEVPIFSTIEEFNQRVQRTQLFGFNPDLAKISELRAFAKERGFDIPAATRKPALIDTLAALLAAKSTKNQKRKKTHYASES